MKILIVKLSSLGDVVHAMPAVQDIRRALPRAQIDWVVERTFAPLVRRCAGVNRVIACELRRWRGAPLAAATRQGWSAFKADLQQEQYDAVIDLQGLSKSALVSWLARLAPGGQRYGLAHQTEGSSFEAPARWVADVAVRVPSHIHAVARSRAVCAQALRYQLPQSESYGLLADVHGARAAINNAANQSSGRRRTVALIHGTSRADKQWPLAHWIELGRRLNAAGFAVALLHGSADEQQQAQAIASELTQAVVWPRLALDDLTDALAGCAGVVGVDSGLSHIAVALDLAHVQIYNFDTAWRTGPVNRSRQCSVFAQPTPSVDAVWHAWQAVCGAGVTEAAKAGANPFRPPATNSPAPPVAAMVRWLYSLLMWLAQPLLRRKLARRGVQESGYLEAVEERFGHYTTPCPAPDGNTIWLHGVSLGETRAAAVLVARLRQRRPNMRLLLTHGTATGRAEGRQLLRPGDLQVWQPWDTPAAARRFVQQFRPRIGILMETEVWPNLVHACRDAGVPLVLANARLSQKSLDANLRLAWLARPAYRALSAIWAQTPADAARFAELGVPVSATFGNIKFDASPDAQQLERGHAWRQQAGRAVVMLASSRAGEEAALLQILKSFRAVAEVDSARAATFSIADDIQWLIVPRHPQRFDEVAALIQAQGWRLSRRSQWGAAPPADWAAPQTVWLGDTLGEMALYYGLADVALLGGSFEPLGGQNLIEAAACGCPVLMGPHTFNFAEAAELAQASGAAHRVSNLTEAVAAADSLSRDVQQLQAARQAGLAFARLHRGATERLCDAIEQLLDGAAATPAPAPG